MGETWDFSVFGPIKPGSVLVARNLPDELRKDFVIAVQEFVLYSIDASQAMSDEPLGTIGLPLVLFLNADQDQDLRLLDEDEMREAGWVRG